MSHLELRYETKGVTPDGADSGYRLEVYDDKELFGSSLLVIHDPRAHAVGIRLEPQQQRELCRALAKNIEIGQGR